MWGCMRMEIKSLIGLLSLQTICNPHLVVGPDKCVEHKYYNLKHILEVL